MWTDPMTRVENLNKSTNWTDLTRGQDYRPQCGRTQWRGSKFKQVHKLDGPHKGSRLQSTRWMDPMKRVENLNKSTNWTDLTKGEDSSPQCGRTQWQGPLYISPQSGWTLQMVNTQVHNLDGPYKGSILKSTTWTDPTKGNTQVHKRGRIPQRVKI